MQRNYPLTALRAFESAGRHLSFIKAAQELYVTPAAISQQIKRLETYLDQSLFRRLPSGLLLTDAGQMLLREVSNAFSTLDDAIEQLSDAAASSELNISVAPMFASKWLVPRLQQFAQDHPHTDLRMSASLWVIDFKRDNFDAAIRLGSGRYPGLVAEELFGESLLPMCSPHLLQNVADGHAALRHMTLLHNDSMAFDSAAPDWPRWLRAAGLTDIDAARGPRFAQPEHAIQAAIDGAGAVLGWQSLAAADIEAGRLVPMSELALPLGSSFYLVYPRASAARAKIALLRDWLQLSNR